MGLVFRMHRIQIVIHLYRLRCSENCCSGRHYDVGACLHNHDNVPLENPVDILPIVILSGSRFMFTDSNVNLTSIELLMGKERGSEMMFCHVAVEVLFGQNP